ncbi:hypothetical protein GCM10025856_14030 [Methylophaga marina]|nr:hypothetical protein GCM10025856_14030 [Methylophaga marina]
MDGHTDIHSYLISHLCGLGIRGIAGTLISIVGVIAMIAMIEDKRVRVAKRNLADAREVYRTLQTLKQDRQR